MWTKAARIQDFENVVVFNRRRFSPVYPSVDGFKRCAVQTNVIGTFNIARHAVALMCENEKNEGQRGVVVNVSSIAAFDGPPTQVTLSIHKLIATCEQWFSFFSLPTLPQKELLLR